MTYRFMLINLFLTQHFFLNAIIEETVQPVQQPYLVTQEQSTPSEDKQKRTLQIAQTFFYKQLFDVFPGKEENSFFLRQENAHSNYSLDNVSHGHMDW